MRATLLLRGDIVITPVRSGLPARIPSVPSKTSASMAASGNARLRLRISRRRQQHVAEPA
jgi:hypothetical protein